MARQRDYASEYRRRIERGLKRGWPRSKARGHSETAHRRAKTSRKSYGREFEKAFKALRVLKNQRLAAESNGISPRRFRQFLREKRLARYRKGKWRFTDQRIRTIRVITTRGDREIKARGYDASSWAMSHRAAVVKFLEDADPVLLQPFESKFIKDISGRKHFFETRPNVLYRLSSAGSERYEAIYRLTT
jgi:hypothetical protein